MSEESQAIDALTSDFNNLADAIDGVSLAIGSVEDAVKTFAGYQPSLRDRFAMAALQGMLADHTRDPTADQAALNAYKYADAMLKWREKVE